MNLKAINNGPHTQVTHCLSFILSAILVLTGCSGTPHKLTIADIAPLHISGNTIQPEQALAARETIDPLELPAQIIEYFDQYLDAPMPKKQRAETLHRVLRSQAFLGIEYSDRGTYTAAEVYRRSAANCLGFSNLYIALARHYGLKARYQMIESYPKWERTGNILAVNIHINTLVELPHKYQLEVDIGRSNSKWRDQSQIISDERALAQFYNNLAMEAYAIQDYVEAYGLINQAMTLAPDDPILWSNLGALYRINQQLEDAERAYNIALEIDDNQQTALNNLAILYLLTDREDEHDLIMKRIQSTRERNPYYHFSLAEKSLAAGKLADASKHLQRAIKINSEEPEFKQLLKIVNYRLERTVSSSPANERLF